MTPIKVRNNKFINFDLVREWEVKEGNRLEIVFVSGYHKEYENADQILKEIEKYGKVSR